MSRILIIDDDRHIRSSVLLDFWLHQIPEMTYEWLVRWPTDFLAILEANPSITHLSLDHDLGHTDVSREINRLIWAEGERLHQALRDKYILVHSMNTPASEKLVDMLKPYCKEVVYYPLLKMVTEQAVTTSVSKVEKRSAAWIKNL